MEWWHWLLIYGIGFPVVTSCIVLIMVIYHVIKSECTENHAKNKLRKPDFK